MALSAKLLKIYIRDKTPSGWLYTFKVKDASLDIGQVNYGAAYDEAIDGSLRSNIRGFRMSIDLPLNKLYGSLVTKNAVASKFETFLGDMMQVMTADGDEYVEISFDGTNFYNFVPDMASYRVAYTNQIARASGSLKFIGQGIITTIDSPLQAPSV